MRRGVWFVVLLVSVLLVAAAGFGIVASGGPDDIGSTDVASGSATTVAAAETTAPAPSIPDTSRSRALVSSPGDDASVPVRLRVDDVALDAPLDSTGVRDDGLMEIPDDGDRAGWYRYGPAPGSGEGSVVLAGHVDTKEGLGVMAALRDVELGALVRVDMSDGTTATYEIVGRKTIAKDALPTAEIFERDGPERLTMITCGGPWRPEASSYRDNVVVVATPVD